ncbi:MAG: hypothetical protein ACT4QA_01945 [Panacagrimonas sp.]
MTIKPLLAVVSLALAGFAAPSSAGGIDIRIGTGYPIVEHYRDYYPPAPYYYYRERRPAYRYNEYNNYFYGGNGRPAYRDDDRHRHDHHCRHDDDRKNPGGYYKDESYWKDGGRWREGHSSYKGDYDRWRRRDH